MHAHGWFWGTGVTVNCVAPGAIRTRIFDGWPESYVQELLEKIPMNRFGTPEELAEMVAFVASRPTPPV